MPTWTLLLGWRGLSTSLHHHHTIEDTHIWPAIRGKLASRPDDLAVLVATEQEHARIDPAIAAVEAAFTDPDEGTQEVAERILDKLPAPVRLLHRFWWNPRYQKARRWE